MPSAQHELLVEILREHPEVLLALLHERVAIDEHADVEVVARPASLRELQPAEFRADAVLVLRSPGGEAPERAFVLEVQLDVDDDKRYTWPLYICGTRVRLRCPVTLVVLTLDGAVAAWCHRPIALDEHGSVVRPLVVGPTDVPVVRDPDAAARLPELAVVSLLAHAGDADAYGIGRALWLAAATLDGSRRALYSDVVQAFLREADRRRLEVEMQLPIEYESDFARRIFAQGEARGLAEGEARGLAEGEVRGLAAAIATVLRARGLPLDDAAAERISACTDRAQLERWVVLAATVASVGALFDG